MRRRRQAGAPAARCRALPAAAGRGAAPAAAPRELTQWFSSWNWSREQSNLSSQRSHSKSSSHFHLQTGPSMWRLPAGVAAAGTARFEFRFGRRAPCGLKVLFGRRAAGRRAGWARAKRVPCSMACRGGGPRIVAQASRQPLAAPGSIGCWRPLALAAVGSRCPPPLPCPTLTTLQGARCRGEGGRGRVGASGWEPPQPQLRGACRPPRPSHAAIGRGRPRRRAGGRARTLQGRSDWGACKGGRPAPRRCLRHPRALPANDRTHHWPGPGRPAPERAAALACSWLLGCGVHQQPEPCHNCDWSDGERAMTGGCRHFNGGAWHASWLVGGRAKRGAFTGPPPPQIACLQCYKAFQGSRRPKSAVVGWPREGGPGLTPPAGGGSSAAPQPPLLPSRATS